MLIRLGVDNVLLIKVKYNFRDRKKTLETRSILPADLLPQKIDYIIFRLKYGANKSDEFRVEVCHRQVQDRWESLVCQRRRDAIDTSKESPSVSAGPKGASLRAILRRSIVACTQAGCTSGVSICTFVPVSQHFCTRNASKHLLYPNLVRPSEISVAIERFSVVGKETQRVHMRATDTCQHTSDIRQDTSGYVRMRQDASGYVRMRQDTSGYVRIR
jgi:hypothetical protein